MGQPHQILAFSSNRTAEPLPVPAASSTDAAEFFADVLAGPSVAATHLRAQIRRVGPYFRTASLTGDPGCGEEAVARALHDMSPVRERAFRALGANEAEASFGGALDTRALMREGMVYLPETGRLSVNAQRGLMRALRERDATSARVVAFVGRGLRPMISAGMFSVELAGCLGALRISMPPLRERAKDIPQLLEQVLAREGAGVSLEPEFVQAAAKASWPGNLDQLQDVLRWLKRRVSVGVWRAEDLALAFEDLRESGSRRSGTTRLVRLEQVVQEHVLGVLVACNGNKLRAAEVLGISRSTLYRMLEGGSQGLAGGSQGLALAG